MREIPVVGVVQRTKIKADQGRSRQNNLDHTGSNWTAKRQRAYVHQMNTTGRGLKSRNRQGQQGVGK
jgi:hypothetical protein